MLSSTREPRVLGGGVQPPQSIFREFGYTSRTFVRDRRGRESRAAGRLLGGVFERGRGAIVGSDNGGGKVPGRAIVAGESFSERGVGPAPVGRVGCLVDGGADQRVPKRERARFERQKSCHFGGLEFL